MRGVRHRCGVFEVFGKYLPPEMCVRVCNCCVSPFTEANNKDGGHRLQPAALLVSGSRVMVSESCTGLDFSLLEAYIKTYIIICTVVSFKAEYFANSLSLLFPFHSVSLVSAWDSKIGQTGAPCWCQIPSAPRPESIDLSNKKPPAHPVVSTGPSSRPYVSQFQCSRPALRVINGHVC